MKKLFEKHETTMCILLIVLYVVINSYCLQNFGTTDYRSSVINTIFSVVLLLLMIILKRTSYYGLSRIREFKRYLYFIPLLLIISVNLWGGIHINNTADEILFHIITMINVGFMEEIIFRGFLFKMMELVVIFYKSKSLIPCIITHALVNALSIFSVENEILSYISSVFLIVVSVIYAVYINVLPKNK